MSHNATPRLSLFTRAGCHLCEEATELLDAVVGRNGYSTIDIEADDDLLLRYAHRIPVLSVDGVDRLEGLITGADVRAIAEPSPA